VNNDSTNKKTQLTLLSITSIFANIVFELKKLKKLFEEIFQISSTEICGLSVPVGKVFKQKILKNESIKKYK
jgi:hypothetical protein